MGEQESESYAGPVELRQVPGHDGAATLVLASKQCSKDRVQVLQVTARNCKAECPGKTHKELCIEIMNMRTVSHAVSTMVGPVKGSMLLPDVKGLLKVALKSVMRLAKGQPP